MSDIVEGMVGWWKLDENAANTTVADSSTNTNTGTASKNTSLFSTAGKIDTCFSFSVTDGIEVADDSSLDLNAGGSISLWIQWSAHSSNYRRFLEKEGDEGQGRCGWTAMYYTDTNNVGFEFWNNNSSGGSLRSIKTNFELNKWYYLTFTWGTTSGRRIYIDGVLDNYSGTTNIVGLNSLSMFIGNLATSGGAHEGLLDDVRVYNVELTADEAKAIFDAGQGPVVCDAGDTNEIQRKIDAMVFERHAKKDTVDKPIISRRGSKVLITKVV